MTKPPPNDNTPDDTTEPLDLIGEHEEELSVDGETVRRRGIYLLPNLFTTAALFSGFYAVISGMHQAFEIAAIAIFVAMVFDGLDGRVARLTNTESKFGAQYDSLTDMVSFGMAPALVAFAWALASLGKVGWLVTFVYVACAALRLARFNTQIGQVDNTYFSGLASPAAAAVIASIIWVSYDEGWIDGDLPLTLSWLMAAITGLVGTLMITKIPYYSFKALNFRGRVPFVVMIAIILIFGVVMLDPPRVLLVGSGVYALSGPVLLIIKKLRYAEDKGQKTEDR